MTKFQCSNCGETGDVEDLVPLDAENRAAMAHMEPGDEPDGMCPKCGTWCDADPTPEERKARLIQDAAPDMLAALRDCLDVLKSPTVQSTDTGFEEAAEMVAVMERARAVIAKAEGR